MIIMMGNFLVEDYHHYYHSYFTMAAGLVEFLGWGVWEVILFGTWLMKNHGLKYTVFFGLCVSNIYQSDDSSEYPPPLRENIRLSYDCAW